MREECEPRDVRKFPSTCNGCGIRTLPRKQHDAPEVLRICELYAVFLKAQHSENRNALMSICTIRQLPFQRKRTNPAQKRRGIESSARIKCCKKRFAIASAADIFRTRRLQRFDRFPKRAHLVWGADCNPKIVFDSFCCKAADENTPLFYAAICFFSGKPFLSGKDEIC